MENSSSSRLSLLVIFIFCAFYFIIPIQARNFHQLPLEFGQVGPESIAFDCRGEGPYVGISDGRILKWNMSQSGWTEFAVTNPQRSNLCDVIHNPTAEQFCGRPLGLKFDPKTCDLYITDSSFGLMKAGREGGVATLLVAGVNGAAFRFLNALDIDEKNRVIYFTDTSTHYHRWEFLAAMISREHTGRLLKYDMQKGSVSVLLSGLSFPNGVALSKDKDFVLVTETTGYQVRRLWLSGVKKGDSDIFVQLSGRPDNIHRDSDGNFWVAQNPTKPVKIDHNGVIVESLDSPLIRDASDVTEFRGTLWIGSVEQRYVMYTT